jgi:hypothetical protein
MPAAVADDRIERRRVSAGKDAIGRNGEQPGGKSRRRESPHFANDAVALGKEQRLTHDRHPFAFDATLEAK